MNTTEAAQKINKLAKEDQCLRNSIPEEPDAQEAHWNSIEKFDIKTTKFLKNVIKQIGLPTISKVGEDASYNAWLLVQHSPELKFQKEYLKLLKENNEDVDVRNIAYLEDRVAMYEGKPQKYGTQLVHDEKSGKMVPYKLRNKAVVDKLRNSLGLEPLAQYVEEFN